MDALSLSQIADYCGGTLHGEVLGVSARQISKDTRTLQVGDLYLALRGENHDGHQFLAAAAAKGACGAIVEVLPEDELPDGFPMIRVSDSLIALQRLAAAWRARLGLRAVCLTGSSGKTSTKEFVAAVLGTRFQVTKTIGNLNNHIGLPLTMLSAEASDEAAVWEIGISHPGEMEPLARLAKPDAVVITNIGVAHIEFFRDRDALAAEKARLAEAVSPIGFVVYPERDDYADLIAIRSAARSVTVGIGAGVVQASNLTAGADGTEFDLTAGGVTIRAGIPVVGEHMVRNALLAVAVGLEFGLSLDECGNGLAEARLTGGRLELREIKGIRFLDDTYNANPESMEAALATLSGVPRSGRRIAVLGKMGELGHYAEIGYARVGRAAADRSDILIVTGAEAAPLARAARAAGHQAVHEVSDPATAAALLGDLAQSGDLVLVKGSRAAKMENVIGGFAK